MLPNRLGALHRRRQSSLGMSDLFSSTNVRSLDVYGGSFGCCVWVYPVDTTFPRTPLGIADYQPGYDPSTDTYYNFLQMSVGVAFSSDHIYMTIDNGATDPNGAWISVGDIIPYSINQWYFVALQYSPITNFATTYARALNGPLVSLSSTITPFISYPSGDAGSSPLGSKRGSICGYKQFGPLNGSSNFSNNVALPTGWLSFNEMYQESLQLAPVSQKCNSYVPFDGQIVDELQTYSSHNNPLLPIGGYAQTSRSPIAPPIPEYLNPSRRNWFLTAGGVYTPSPYTQIVGGRTPTHNRVVNRGRTPS